MTKQKQIRVENAKMRQESRNQLSDRQQIAMLDTRLGKSNGASKERKKLWARIKDVR